MNETTFWMLIQQIDRLALARGDDSAAVVPLANGLSNYSIKDIAIFKDFLAKVLYDIDGELFANEAGDSGNSGDGFLYARCYVVAQGREHYEAVKVDPSKMPKSLDEWAEALLYVPSQAWSVVTGQDAQEWDYDSPLSYETGSNRENWP